MATRASVKKDIDGLYLEDFVARGVAKESAAIINAVKDVILHRVVNLGFAPNNTELAFLLREIADSIATNSTSLPPLLVDLIQKGVINQYNRNLQKLDNFLAEGP